MKNTPLFFGFIVFCILLSANTSYAQEKKDSATYYYYKIIDPKENSDLSSGYQFYKQHKDQSLLKKDTLRAINDLRMMGLSQLKMGLLHESEGTSLEALELLDSFKYNDTLKQARYGLLTHLGIVYRSSMDYDKAIEVYQKALQITHSKKDSITIINNIGNIYFDLKEYVLALNQFEMIYTKSLNHSNPLQKARVLNNLGAVQSKLQHPDALQNLNTSLSIRKEQENNTGIYQSYKNLFHYYKDKGDKKTAQLYADSAYIAVLKLNNKPYLQDALALHTELTEDAKIIEYKRLTDSIHKAEQIQKNDYSFNKYRYDKQEKIAIENELQKEKEKRLKFIYQSLAIFILIVFILVYFLLKAKSKKEKLEEIYNTETRISKKIHDEVANDVYQVMAKLQNEKDPDDQVLDDLENIYSKTRDISQENSFIDVDTNYNELLNDLLSNYKTENSSIITKDLNAIDWNAISGYKKTTLYRVLQELMTNMKKHSMASIVALSFQQEGNSIHISYSDNGIGTILKKQVGLQNVENRMESIRGTIIFETEIDKGFKAKIRI